MSIYQPSLEYYVYAYLREDGSIGGLISGIVILDPFDKPKSITGEIAYSLGHTFGFVGSLFGTGGAGALIGRGVVMAGSLAFARAPSRATTAVMKGVVPSASVLAAGRRAEAIVKFGQALPKFRSVPMAAADFVQRKALGGEAGKTVLKFLEGWDNETVAKALNKPVGAVKSLQHRALAQLQKLLLDEV